MTKNPFEVRLDVLKMAQEMLETEHRTKELKFREQVETMRSSEQVPVSDILSYIDSNTPAAYTPDDVIARSSALYNFISDKK
jgi:hypothetical protein